MSVTPGSIDFVNRYVDGNLDIKKTVGGDTTGADPNQLFTFRVELVNEEGQPLEGVSTDDVTFEALGSQAAGTTTPEDPNGGDGAVASASTLPVASSAQKKHRSPRAGSTALWTQSERPCAGSRHRDRICRDNFR